jgi:enamine deaminase RidA (YjgF/YER057c/UK114 family)
MCGKLGSEYTIEEGQEASRRCMLNILSNLHHELGDLNRIKKFVKILGFVASAPDFYEHPQVINGASQMLKDVSARRPACRPVRPSAWLPCPGISRWRSNASWS